MKFWIEVYDSSDAKLGDGPITTAQNWTETDRLSRAGEFSFDMPASDPKATLIQKKRVVKCFGILDGEVTLFGAGIIDETGVSVDDDGLVLLAVSGSNMLRDLNSRSVAFSKTLGDSDTLLSIEDICDSWLEGTAVETGDNMEVMDLGWVSDHQTGAEGADQYATFAGETVLGALVALAKHEDLDFIYYPTVSEFKRIYWLVDDLAPGIGYNVRAVVPTDSMAGEGDTDLCYITNLEVVEETSDLITRIYPYGAGNAANRITLGYTDRSAPAGYTLSATDNYIKRDAAETTYGRIERYLSYKDIGPIYNTESDIERASNALFDATLAQLQKESYPYRRYRLSVTKLEKILYPGSVVRVVYRRVRDGETYLDLDEDLYVLEATRRIDKDGVETVALDVATAKHYGRSDESELVGQIEGGRIYEAQQQLTVAKDRVGPYVRRISSTINASFKFSIGGETTALNYAFLRFRSGPLTANSISLAEAAEDVGTSGSGGGSTPTSASGGGGTESSSSEQHQHTSMIAGVSGGEAVNVSSGVLRAVGGPHTIWTSLSGGHSHDVTFPSHTHSVSIPNHSHDVTIPAHSHEVTYGIYQDTETPDEISVWINGVDRTIALGGPWAVGGGAVEATVNITPYLASQSFLRGNHTIEFRCIGDQGEIEAEVVMLASVQAIATDGIYYVDGDVEIPPSGGGGTDLILSSNVETFMTLTGDTLDLDDQLANLVFASPDGATGKPIFRALVVDDIPAGIVRDTRQIISGNGLTGGGDLSANRTLAVDLATSSSLAIDAAKLRLDAHDHQAAGYRGGQLDHGAALTGLADDDHTQYIHGSPATTARNTIQATADDAIPLTLKMKAGTPSADLWQVTAADDSILLQVNSVGDLMSGNFASGIDGAGWQVTHDGDLTANSGYFRGTIYASTFTYKEINALNGYFMVTNASVLTEAITSSQTTIYVKDPVFASGSWLRAQQTVSINPLTVAVEWIKVTSSGTWDSGRGAYAYTVSRNQSSYAGGAAHAWGKGLTLTEWGRDDEGGWVTMVGGSTDSEGPYVGIAKRTGSSVDDFEQTTRFGNLAGTVGDNDERYGIIVGDLSAGSKSYFQAHQDETGTAFEMHGVKQYIYDASGNQRGLIDPAATGVNPLVWYGVSASDRKFTLQADGTVVIDGAIVSGNGVGVVLSDVSLHLPFTYAGGNRANTNGHLGQKPTTESGAVIGVSGGPFGNGALQVSEAITNIESNPVLGNGTTGWYVYGSNTFTTSSDAAMYGQYSCKVTYQNDLRLCRQTALSGLTANEKYVALTKVFIPGDWDGGTISIEHDGNFVGATILDASTTSTKGQWVEIFQLIELSTDTSGFFRIKTSSAPTAGKYIFIDGMMVAHSEYKIPFIYGDMPGCSWSGTAHNSTSTAAVAELKYSAKQNISTRSGMFSTWIALPDDSGNFSMTQPGIFRWWDNYNTESIYVYFNDSKSSIFWASYSGSVSQGAITTSSLGWLADEWHHIAVTWEENSVKIYIDGVLDVSDTSWTPPNIISDELWIGRQYNSSRTMCGYLADMAFANRVYTADEIKAIHDSGVPVTVPHNNHEFMVADASGARTWVNSSGFFSEGADGTPSFAAVNADSTTINGETFDEKDLLMGDNSSGVANMKFDSSVGEWLFRAGTTTEAKINSDGAIEAGGGTIILDSDGYSQEITSTAGSGKDFRFTNGGTVVGYLEVFYASIFNLYQYRIGLEGVTANSYMSLEADYVAIADCDAGAITGRYIGMPSSVKFHVRDGDMSVDDAVYRSSWFMARRSSAQTMSGVATDNVDWNDQTKIDTNYYTHSTSTNPDRITVDKKAWYKVDYAINLENNVADRVAMRARPQVNGANIDGGDSYTYLRHNTYGRYGTCAASLLVAMDANEYLTILLTGMVGSGSLGETAVNVDILADSNIVIEAIDYDPTG